MSAVNRRSFLRGAAAAAAVGVGACGSRGLPRLGASGHPLTPMSPEVLLSDTQRRTFDYFWQTTDSARGLAPDLWPDPAPASIAAMGFALTAIPVGVEHGWVSRTLAAQRVRAWLEFLRDAPQGSGFAGFSGYRGFFYHFLQMDTGTRYRDSELSTVDTALLVMGVRCCGQYFAGHTGDEAAIRALADFISERVDWNWTQANGPGIAMGWRPETGFMSADWVGYNEATFVYLLALGSKNHAVQPEAWAAWTKGYDASWGKVQGIEHLTFGPLFGHQFTQVWIDLRGIRDSYMSTRGLDYFQNTQRAVRAQRAYAISNPLQWEGYGAEVWGLSACDGPSEMNLKYRGVDREFHTYAGRGVGLRNNENFDDGTLSASAVLGSLPFMPEWVTASIAAMHRRYGTVIYAQYGFLDSFNPSFKFDVPLVSGRRVGELGWVDSRYYGITQGPIVAMIENQRSGLLWRLMRGDPVIRAGLLRAGFKGGWLG